MSHAKASDLWVFAYGSLMWRPGFDHAERVRAALRGHARRFCLDSVVYRGRPGAPGLVLALDPDPAAICRGVAYRVPAAEREAALAYLRERELVTYAYREAFLEIEIARGRGVEAVEAVTYVIDPGHEQYRGFLSPAEQAAIIARAAGEAGTNAEYLANTIRHLAEEEIVDEDLSHLAELVRGIEEETGP